MTVNQEDPRNATAIIERKEELLAAARSAGVNVADALQGITDDNVAQIGVIARLLGIDALAALNPAVPLSEIRGSSDPIA